MQEQETINKLLHKIRTRIAKSFQRTPTYYKQICIIDKLQEICFNRERKARLLNKYSAILNLTNKIDGG